MMKLLCILGLHRWSQVKVFHTQYVNDEGEEMHVGINFSGWFCRWCGDKHLRLLRGGIYGGHDPSSGEVKEARAWLESSFVNEQESKAVVNYLNRCKEKVHES